MQHAPPMSPLHGLRLNCLLAPLVVAALGAAAVLSGAVLHRGALADASAATDLAVLRGLAQLSESAAPGRLPAWLSAHPVWRGVARIQVRGEALIVLGQTGEVRLRGEASPELLLAYQGAQRWSDHGRTAVAVPCLPQQGEASVIVAWREPAQPPPWWPWIALAGGVLGLGGGLGAYLVARVYRPVEWMERAAAAAAEGGMEPPGGADSPETASLRSSLATLISHRKHSDLADAKRET